MLKEQNFKIVSLLLWSTSSFTVFVMAGYPTHNLIAVAVMIPRWLNKDIIPTIV